MSNPFGLIDEIRLNSQYAHHVASEFKDDSSQDTDPIIKKKTITTQDLLQRMKNENLVGSEVMPVNCRYLERTPHGYMVVIEEPPAMRTISIRKNFEREWLRLKEKGFIEKTEYYKKQGTYSATRLHTFTLAMPYVIHMMYIDNSYGLVTGRVFVRPAQLSGLSDYVCKMPTSNISDSQSVCFGDQGGQRQRSLSAAVSHIIMVFWSASFNTDYTYNLAAYAGVPILGNFLEWEHYSKTNPMFIYSADWIHYSTIKDQLDVLRGTMERRGGRQRGLTFDDFSRLFYQPQDTLKEEKVSPRGRKTHKLFYDICQGVYLNRDIFLNVGDTIKLNNGDYAFVDTFIGFMDGGDVKYVGLEYKGKQMLMKYDNAAIKFLTQNIEDQIRVSELTLENGETIKPNDIIIVKHDGAEKYQKVKYIRKSRGGDENIFEVRMGNNYYFSNMLNASVFNIEEPEVDGCKIDKNEEYIVAIDISTSAITVGGAYKYENIDVDDRSSNVVLKFKCLDRFVRSEIRSIRLSERSRHTRIINTKDARRMPEIFRVGRKLQTAYWDDTPIEGAFAYGGRAYIQHNYRWGRPNNSDVTKLIDGNKFHVVGVDGDTTFEVGDKVVVANWKNPLDVLNVKTIYGFKVEEMEGKISFILADKNDNLSEVLYVENQRSGLIYTGRVRKVTNQFEKLKVGTKIIAKEAGVYAFPKKDVNIVVAIIIDGPFEPLVLCSNGCTLWYSDVMEKFTKVTMKSKKWATLQHIPLDLSKIKFQAGDIVVGQMNYTSPQGFMLSGEATRLLKATPLETYTGYPDSYSFDRYFQADAIFDCIPAPRISQRIQGDLGYKYGFLDFHGNCIISEDPVSKYTFINDRGI